MSDLTGEDAFDRVLDRMVEAEKQSARLHDSTAGDRHQVRALQLELDKSRDDLATARQKLRAYEGSEQAFTALYDAVEAGAKQLRLVGDDATADALLAAITGAKKFIDPIPF